MPGVIILHGVLVDEAMLDVDELARACGTDPDWVNRHVQAGLLGQALAGQWRFGSVDLARARRLLELERIFDADDYLAALVIDLSDEVKRLRARLLVVSASEAGAAVAGGEHRTVQGGKAIP